MKNILIKILMIPTYLTDALLGELEEYSVYPNDEGAVKIRHIGGIWTMRPVYTYTKRRLSFVKSNYRYGWSVVEAPEGYEQYVGTDNLTKDVGTAIYNMLEGQKMIDKYLKKHKEGK